MLGIVNNTRNGNPVFAVRALPKHSTDLFASIRSVWVRSRRAKRWAGRTIAQAGDIVDKKWLRNPSTATLARNTGGTPGARSAPLTAVALAAAVLIAGAVSASQAASDQTATQAEIDQFWDQTLERASKIPLEATSELVNEPNPYIKYKVTYRSLGGVPIRAYLAKPYETPGKTPRRFPAFVTAPGYLGDGMGVDLSECQRGYIILHVCPRSQGDGAQLWKIDGPDFLTWHLGNPEGYYYQGAYVDVIRGIDYLCSRPDVDKARIGAMGTSQGGGIALAVGALDPRVKAVVARVPFLCDMRRAAAIDGSLINTLLKKYHALTSENLKTLDYFDPANLVHRLQAPTLVNAGGKDTAVPVETVQALYDRLPGIKAIAFFPDATHTCPLEVYQMGWDWMERHLKRTEF